MSYVTYGNYNNSSLKKEHFLSLKNAVKPSCGTKEGFLSLKNAVKPSCDEESFVNLKNAIKPSTCKKEEFLALKNAVKPSCDKKKENFVSIYNSVRCTPKTCV